MSREKVAHRRWYSPGRNLVFLWLAMSAMSSHADELAIHLPSHTAGSASRLASGLDQLADHLGRSLDGASLEIEIFRRQQDMHAFLSSRDVKLVLSDASLLTSSPVDLIPLGRFVYRSSGTYRRVVVVPSASSAQRLSDLRGQELTIVETSGSDVEFLKSTIFGGELDPNSYFSVVRPVVDDAEAVTDLLFGQASAALVSEHAPLLLENLDTKLRVIYRSNPLSMPVVSARVDALTDEQLGALRASLEALTPGDSPLLARLGIQGFEKLGGGVAVDSVEPRGHSETRVMSLVTQVELTDDPPPVPAISDLPLPYIVVVPEPAPVAESLLDKNPDGSR